MAVSYHNVVLPNYGRTYQLLYQIGFVQLGEDGCAVVGSQRLTPRHGSKESRMKRTLLRQSPYRALAVVSAGTEIARGVRECRFMSVFGSRWPSDKKRKTVGTRPGRRAHLYESTREDVPSAAMGG